MNGREEHELQVNDKVKQKLKKAPKYVTKFYNYLTDKTYTTKSKYIEYVLCYLEYLKDCGYDIQNINIFKHIKSSDIREYMNSLSNISESTKACRMYGIKCFFQYLYDDDHIVKNPFDKVKMPKDNEEHKITFLTPDEINIVKNNILNGTGSESAKRRQARWKYRDYAIFMTALSLGLRNSSLTEIDINDIDFDNNTIKIVEKGNKIRTIMISDNLKEVILQWLESRKNIPIFTTSKALFISDRGQRITPIAISKMLDKYTYNIGKRITPHKLRSTCATNVYNTTGDIYLTANVLGHSNIANTRRYADISEARKQKAATAMDKILF